MDSKLCLFAVLLLATLACHQVLADHELRTEVWDPSAKDYKVSLGSHTWDEIFKRFYTEFDNKSSDNDSESEFYYSHVLPKAGDINDLDLKCVPGRTVIKVLDRPPDTVVRSSDEDYNEVYSRRSHMNTGKKDGYCQICVCSVEGKDEYCSQRPAMNVNECLMMAQLKTGVEGNMPFDHTKTLAYRIRRDYIWHNDEIPYEAKAPCRRGHSYYTNSITANETDIDVASDVESLLDYSNKSICYYCLCSTDGKSAGCISRLPWFCEYYRAIRKEGAERDMYTTLFQQDRPTYFRQLSWRLRRSMDDGMYEFMNTGGDTLCCNHPDGHRRTLHSNVRSKIWGMRRKVPKENLLSGSPGGDYADFVVNNDK